jgi:hypothetical protein
MLAGISSAEPASAVIVDEDGIVASEVGVGAPAVFALAGPTSC